MIGLGKGPARVAAVTALALTAAACAGGRSRSGGLRIPGGGRAATAPAAGIGVNAFLWRATLDTLAFMPLASADPYGGVVITDWYINPEKTDERFKATVYILDTRLRADGLNVTVFKQVKGADGQWVDAAVTPQTSIDIENAILTRARQVRLSTPAS
jgi:hypothetical protein